MKLCEVTTRDGAVVELQGGKVRSGTITIVASCHRVVMAKPCSGMGCCCCCAWENEPPKGTFVIVFVVRGQKGEFKENSGVLLFFFVIINIIYFHIFREGFCRSQASILRGGDTLKININWIFIIKTDRNRSRILTAFRSTSCFKMDTK